ncbi:MAG TPA: hypothetical protein VK582_00615 [Pyrinomonadaceae bacterium]|nr:hypothetical protein [Pyrinomonadaceae bacterium]
MDERRDNVHPKIEKLRTMIATTVIGNRYVSCVVVHIFQRSTTADPVVTRANLLGITRTLW